MSRIVALIYGALCYAFFFVTFLYALAFVENAFVRRTIDVGPEAPLTEALIIDLVLLSLVAIQHRVMARPQFKAWWTEFVPKEVERSTYVLCATSALALLCWQWRPIPAVVWEVQAPALVGFLTTLSVGGWGVVAGGDFLLHHFE